MQNFVEFYVKFINKNNNLGCFSLLRKFNSQFLDVIAKLKEVLNEIYMCFMKFGVIIIIKPLRSNSSLLYDFQTPTTFYFKTGLWRGFISNFQVGNNSVLLQVNE